MTDELQRKVDRVVTKQVENNQARKIDSGSLAWSRALRYKGAIEFRLLSSFEHELCE